MVASVLITLAAAQGIERQLSSNVDEVRGSCFYRGYTLELLCQDLPGDEPGCLLTQVIDHKGRSVTFPAYLCLPIVVLSYDDVRILYCEDLPECELTVPT